MNLVVFGLVVPVVIMVIPLICLFVVLNVVVLILFSCLEGGDFISRYEKESRRDMRRRRVELKREIKLSKSKRKRR